jgi:DNA-binding GntR family transcriptional regulator
MRIDDATAGKTPINLAHKLAADIRRDIVAGIYSPGERLKNEELAARYKVSASPVREALWALQGEGFVILAPHQGARVRAVDDDFVRNIFEIRSLIEPMYVARFCTRASSEDIVRLKEAEEMFAQLGRTDDAFGRETWNSKFHDIMNEGDVNTEGLLVLERHYDLMSTLRPPTAFSKHRQEMRVQEHHAIVEAVEQNNPDLAREVAAEHVRNAAVDLLEDLGRMRAQQRTRSRR